ncbi:unnamed protein product [Gadus morhua 'NCC']
MHMRAKVAAMDSPPVNKTRLFVYALEAETRALVSPGRPTSQLEGVQAVGFRTLPDGDKEVLDPCAKEHVVPPAMWDAAFGQTVWKSLIGRPTVRLASREIPSYDRLISIDPGHTKSRASATRWAGTCTGAVM